VLISLKVSFVQPFEPNEGRLPAKSKSKTLRDFGGKIIGSGSITIIVEPSKFRSGALAGKN